MADKKFGLNFECKVENCVEELKGKHIFLAENVEKSFVRNAGKKHNILIEGENYAALKMLQFTHAGKIDVIYLDPPYNTGKKDEFCYNDKFVDAEDTFKHSKWLSFMEKRLQLAWKLLSDRGVIFVSIDDNEQAYLKVLMDGIFGENNFIANLIWKKKATNGGISNGGFGINIQTEYVLMYSKNKKNIVINGVPGGDALDAKYKFEDKRGKYRLVDLAGYGLSYQASMDYEICNPNGKMIRANDVMGVGYKARWRWGKDTYETNKNLIVWVDDKPKTKTYMNGDCQMVHPSSILDDKDLLANTDKSHEVVSELNDFTYRKPVELIKRLLFISSQKDSIILDFFAGSGTTGQAVSELNKEDGGSRQFILVTNNDKSDKLPNGICHSVTYPRLVKTIGDDNLKYYNIKYLTKEGKHSTNHIDQLVDDNKLLHTLQLKHSAFKEVEKAKDYAIFANHDDTFFLGVYHKFPGVNMKKFKQKLDAYCKNNEFYYCKYDTYPADYYNVVK